MLLAIDTATAACSVALLDGATVIASAHEEVGRGHAERLLPMIAEVLGDALPSAIAVDCGPGSFTGIRVGIAAARALALGWGIPVRGFSAMDLLAARAGRETDAAGFAVALTGGHGELFVQRFAGRPPVAITALASLPPAEARVFAPDPDVAGNGAAVMGAVQTSPLPLLPDARDVRLLGAEAAALAPVPIYGRAPDAKPRAAEAAGSSA